MYTSLSHDVSKRVITLLPHEQDIVQEEYGSVEFWRLKRYTNSNFPQSVRWSNITWANHFERGGRRKKRFQFCTNRTGTVILFFQAIQGHSGEYAVDPSLLDSVLIAKDFFRFDYHFGSLFQHALHLYFWINCCRKSSWTRSTNGILYSRWSHGKIWVDKEGEHDMYQPRCARYKHVRKVAKHAVYLIDICRAQRT